ncbi:MAG: hypothetical protein JNL57_12365 [Bacteroidetes bacterium]|nr:hypothetical protein [Bacteroidota bacterium]
MNEDIFTLMERRDLALPEVEKRAAAWFSAHGTGQGSGYKQYQRWLYERQFHLTANGEFVQPESEDKAYYDALRQAGVQSRAGFAWQELGPDRKSPTSSWNPGVGRVTSVAVSATDTNLIYVSSPGGGIWKSTNAGKSWVSLVDFVNSSWMNIFHIVIDPANNNIVYASVNGGGVIKSTNGGSTWSATGSGPGSTKQVKINPWNTSMVFAAAGNGIWRSVNGGAKWTQVETESKEDIEFNPATPAIMYAAGSAGKYYVWRSTDTGKTWKGIDSAAGMYKMGRTLMAVSAANPARVYVAQARGSIFGRMYRSDDTGKTYKVTILGDASKGKNFFGYNSDGKGTTGQANYDMAICANPANANEVHIAGIISWKSENGADSFYATSEWIWPNGRGYNHADIHALEYAGNRLFSGSDGGVYISRNAGGDWQDLSTGLGIRQFYRIACAPSDVRVIAGGAQDNGTSVRRTDEEWADWLGADGMDCLISTPDANFIYGTSQNGGIYRSVNGGASYTDLSKPSNGNWVTPLAMHPSSKDTWWGGWTGIYRTGDGGYTWKRLCFSINTTMDVLTVAPSNPRYIYAAKGTTLYRLTDGGDTFSKVTAPSNITSIFVSKKNPLKIWISCNSSSNRIFVSENAGDSFQNISAGLPSTAARSVVVDEDSIETIYAGMNLDVFYRDNVSNKWLQHATGLPLVAVNEVEIQKSGGKLRVATYGRGVWESDLRNVKLPCYPPSALVSSGKTDSTAVIGWTASQQAKGYRVEFRRASDTTWIVSETATALLKDTLKSLKLGTAYVCRVRSNCSTNNSTWAEHSFSTTGVNAVHVPGIQNDFVLYPDPVQKEIGIRKWHDRQETVEFKVLDASGRVVMGGRSVVYPGWNEFKADAGTLPPGVYIFRLQASSGNSEKHFLVSGN